MKKLLYLCSLAMIVIFGYQVQVTAETKESISETIISESDISSSSAKVNSHATISFSRKTIKETNGNSDSSSNNKASSTIPSSGARLPSTGEALGIGVSMIGFLLLFIIFRKEIKSIFIEKKFSQKDKI